MLQVKSIIHLLHSKTKCPEKSKTYSTKFIFHVVISVLHCKMAMDEIQTVMSVQHFYKIDMMTRGLQM